MAAVSVCIPTYEANLEFLGALVESLGVVPEGMSLQIVVSDDCSANFADVERSVHAAVPSALISRAESRLGMVGNWNRAIAEASGRWIVLPGQDDLLDLQAIAALTERAEEAGASLAFGHEAFVTADGSPRVDPRRGPTVDLLWSANERRRGVMVDARIGLLVGSVLGDPCAAIISADAVRRLGSFSPRFGHAADAEFWMRVSAAGERVLLTDLPTSTRRIHDDNATASHVRTGVSAADRAGLLQDFGDVLPPPLLAQAAGRLLLHRTFDLVRTRGRPPKIRPVAPPATNPAGLARAVAVDLKRDSALSATRRRFEQSAS